MAPASPAPLVLIAVTQAAVARQLIKLVRQIAPDVQLELARQGKEVCERVAKRKPHLLVIDTALPVLNGVEVLQHLRKTPVTSALPVLLLAENPAASVVRSIAPLNPKALLTLPFDEARLLKLLREVLIGDDALPSTLSLETFLTRKRTDLADLEGLQDMRRVLGYCLGGELRSALLQQLCNNDWPLYERLNEKASAIAGYRCEKVDDIVAHLGLAQSFNQVLEFELERAAQLADQRLGAKLLPCLAEARQAATLAAWLARQTRLDPAFCYLASLLLHLGEFALAHSLQIWQNAGRELTDAELKIAFELNAASFGSALRIAWRLPIPLREAVAGFYGLLPGVVSREALLMNLTGQMLALGELSPVNLSEDRTVRMLGLNKTVLSTIPRQLLGA